MLAQNFGLILITLLLQSDANHKQVIPFGGTDFKQYFATSKLIIQGHNPYDYDKVGMIQHQLGYAGEPQVPYGPPTSLLFFIPLGWFDFQTAIQVNFALNLVMLIGSCYVWGKLFIPQHPLVSIAMIAVWVPTWTLLGLGQVSSWLLFGFTMWFWAMKQQRPVLAGIALTCSIIKPHLAFGIALYALLNSFRNRHWRMLAAFLGTILATILLSFIIRPTIWVEYLGSLERSNPGQWYNATLDGWGRFTFGPRFSFISGAWCLLLLELIVFLAWYRPLQDKLAILVLALWLAASPYAFSYDFSLLLPAMVMTLGFAINKNHVMASYAAIAWLLLSLTYYVYKGPWYEYQFFIIPLCGLIITSMLLIDRKPKAIEPA